MNFLAMQTFTRVLLGETTTEATDADATAYTDQEIKDQINRSALAVAERTLSLLTYAKADCVIDQQRYALPADFLALKDVQLIVDSSRKKQLVQCTYDEFESKIADNYAHSAEPTHYKIEFGSVATDSTAPGDIWLWPIPDSATYDLRVVFYQKPTTLSDNGDVCELQEQMHDTVCYHAAMILSRKIDDLTRFRELSALFTEAIQANEESIHRQDRSGAKFGHDHYLTQADGFRPPHPGFRR